MQCQPNFLSKANFYKDYILATIGRHGLTFCIIFERYGCYLLWTLHFVKKSFWGLCYLNLSPCEQCVCCNSSINCSSCSLCLLLSSVNNLWEWSTIISTACHLLSSAPPMRVSDAQLTLTHVADKNYH